MGGVNDIIDFWCAIVFERFNGNGEYLTTDNTILKITRNDISTVFGNAE